METLQIFESCHVSLPYLTLQNWILFFDLGWFLKKIYVAYIFHEINCYLSYSFSSLNTVSLISLFHKPFSFTFLSSFKKKRAKKGRENNLFSSSLNRNITEWSRWHWHISNDTPSHLLFWQRLLIIAFHARKLIRKCHSQLIRGGTKDRPTSAGGALVVSGLWHLPWGGAAYSRLERGDFNLKVLALNLDKRPTLRLWILDSIFTPQLKMTIDHDAPPSPRFCFLAQLHE